MVPEGCAVNPGCHSVMSMSEITTLADVERMCWRLSGWQVEQRSVDTLLAIVDAYARGVVLPAEDRRGLEGGAGEAEPPAETLPPPDVAVEIPEPAAELQTDAQSRDLEGAYVVTVTRIERPDPEPEDEPEATGQGDGSDLDAYLAPPEERVRTCRKCGLTFALAKFSRDKSSRGGRKTACTPCENIRRRDERRAKRAAEHAARHTPKAA